MTQYFADGSGGPPAPVPLQPATPAPAPVAAAPPPQTLSADALASFQATILAGLQTGFEALAARLSPPPAPAPVATAPAGVLGTVQNAANTGAAPAAPPAPTPASIFVDSSLAEFTKRAGATFGMVIQQQARSVYVLNKKQQFEDPVARCKALYGESHPATLAMAQQCRGIGTLAEFQNYTLAGQNTRESSLGGGLVQVMVYDFLRALKERAVVRSSGARSVRSVTGVMEVPGADGSTSAGYIGEGEIVLLSNMTFKKDYLISCKLGGKAAWTWESLNRPAQDLFEIVLNNLFEEMALKEDLAFLRSDGSGGEPKGILHQLSSANRVTCQSGWAAAGADDKIIKAETDRSAMEGKIRDNFLRDDGTSVWFMPPIVWRWLTRARTSQAVKAFDETNQGRWGNAQVKDTSLLRSNLGGSGILSEMIYVQASNILIADESEMRTETSNAFTVEKGGVRYTAADLDMTVTQVVAMHDMALLRSIAASSSSDVPYR